MYQDFYGLSRAPFDLAPNPKFLLLTPTHREALHTLEYAITFRKGIVLLTGDAGTGKTTLLRKALSSRLSAGGTGDVEAVDIIYVRNPRLEARELFEHLATGLDLPLTATSSRPTFLKHLERALVSRQKVRRAVALIVDEAQALPDDLLEELRLLTNIESDDTKLLPVVLAGQPELADRLSQYHLRQFKQRIAIRCRLKAFDLQETATYIFGRVRLAGGDAAQLFSRDAVIAIHCASRGIPRTISVICDNALVTGFALGRRVLDAGIIEDVCRDLDLTVSEAQPHLTSQVINSDGTSRVGVSASNAETQNALPRFKEANQPTVATQNSNSEEDHELTVVRLSRSVQ